MKRWLAVFVAIVCFTSTAIAETWRVFDNIGVFTDEDIEEIERLILDFQRNTNMDFAVLTMDDYFGENSKTNIVNAFYYSNNFGFGSQSNGIVDYFYVHNGFFHHALTRYGEMVNILDNETCDSIWKLCSTFIDDGDVKGAVIQMIKSTTEAVEAYKKGR